MVVVCYQQDRYTRGGGCSADYMKISFDGGDTFEAPIALPNVLCFGGPYRRTSNHRVGLTPEGEILFTGVPFDINPNGTQCKIGVSVTKYNVISRKFVYVKDLDPQLGLINSPTATTSDYGFL